MTKTLNNYLRTHRKHARLSQRDVARALGQKCGTVVSKHETNERVPHLDTALAYEALFRVPVRQLFQGRFEKVERRVRASSRALGMGAKGSGPGKSIPTPNRPFTRILSLAPHTKGLGYAVFEGPERLVDWGFLEVRPKQRADVALRVQVLLHRYQPAHLVGEDPNDPKSRRSPAIKALIKRITSRARARRIPPVTFTGGEVRDAFAATRAKTKHEIAIILASRYPQISHRRPANRRRTPWKSEDTRMPLFWAVALGVSYYHHREGWEPRPR
ncbi:MAG: helix-turn-helix transcriptional regulator [Gemmatimonadota bacterium]